MNLRRIALALLALSFCCAVTQAQEAQAKEASLILVNGKVWTENPAQPIAHAVALDGNKIVAVGDDASIRKFAGPGTKIIDLHGRLLLPGFNDAHVHFLDGGAGLISVELGTANSPDEFKERIAKFAKTRAPGTWLRNGNWDHQRWNPPNLPTRLLIDDATGDHPVLLWRTDGHMALANSLALKLAGIDRSTKDPPGGEIVRDKDGNPTGILKDSATALLCASYLRYRRQSRTKPWKRRSTKPRLMA
jgi:predicted amidohydrolase YtcJ